MADKICLSVAKLGAERGYPALNDGSPDAGTAQVDRWYVSSSNPRLELALFG